MDFEDFVAAHFDALSRYAAVLTGDRQLAHDVLVDSLIVASARWGRIGMMDHPVSYVRRVITTTFLSHYRSVNRRRTDQTDPVSLDALPRAEVSAYRAVEDRDLLDRLICELPQRQVAAVVMRYYLDCPDSEIAAALGCSLATVRSHLFRAMSALRLHAADLEKG
jgi:RNA polymerase sigma factor (sigma-70 family)